MSDIWIVFAIIAVTIVLFILDRLPVIVVCVGCAMALYGTGVLSINQALAGFGDPATVFVASLFVVAGALEKTGLTTWAGQMLMRNVGTGRTRLMVMMMLLSAVMSAVLTLNGGAAALLPVVMLLAARLGRAPSQLLMPMVCGGHAGSMLALTGTPVNVLVLEASLEAGERGFRYFEFAYAGVFLAAGTIVLAILLGERLLPVRENRAHVPDYSRYAGTIISQFHLDENVHQLSVLPDSPLVGQRRAELDLSAHEGAVLLTVLADSTGAARLGRIQAGDKVVVRATLEPLAALAAELTLSLAEEAPFSAGLFTAATGLAEVMLPPRSPLVGQHLAPGMLTTSGNLVVLAVQRDGVLLDEGTTLARGDVLLLQGTWWALDTYITPAKALLVNAPEQVRRQIVPIGRTAYISLAIMLAMVVALATGVMPAAAAGILAAGAIMVAGILTTQEVYRSIDWTTVILIGAMMPLSDAITDTGAAQMLADGLLSVVGSLGPYALLAGLFVLTAVLGQVISNTATALIIIPISVVAAQGMGVSPQPVLMSVAIASAAALLTPISTPANLMIMEPGNYRFGDYWKFGLPIMIWFFAIAVFLVPLIWHF